jgi:phosphomannomutase
MRMTDVSSFKAYDIRGEIGVNIDASFAYKIGRAVAQHLTADSVVIGFDARETSPAFADASAQGVLDAGANALRIGLVGTEEVYWAVTEFNAAAGIMVTASHNPINYNGMKIVKSGSEPLDDKKDFEAIKSIVETGSWQNTSAKGQNLFIEDRARAAYVSRVVNFIDLMALRPLKIVVNSGNGAAGPTFDAIADYLSAQNIPLTFERVNHQPDHTFPNGIPNPLLPKNHHATASIVKTVEADFGVAFDGDFDRCFLFDEKGTFVPGEYIVGLLASIFLEKEAGAKIVHDPRVIWNTQEAVRAKGGIAIQSKTGHAFIKQAMRDHGAVYGGEISAHHYFRDFSYCDSGMIPWLLVAELVSKSGRSLGSWIKDCFNAFPSSGEANFKVSSANKAIAKVLDVYQGEALSIDYTDGVSLTFENWRFNLRQSNTEPLVRLNIETNGKNEKPEKLLESIAGIISGTRV